MNTDTNMALPSKIRWESYTMRELVEKDNMLILRESSKTKMGILFSFLFLIGYPIFTALEDVDFDLDMMIDSFQVGVILIVTLPLMIFFGIFFWLRGRSIAFDFNAGLLKIGGFRTREESLIDLVKFRAITRLGKKGTVYDCYYETNDGDVRYLFSETKSENIDEIISTLSSKIGIGYQNDMKESQGVIITQHKKQAKSVLKKIVIGLIIFLGVAMSIALYSGLQGSF